MYIYEKKIRNVWTESEFKTNMCEYTESTAIDNNYDNIFGLIYISICILTIKIFSKIKELLKKSRFFKM